MSRFVFAGTAVAFGLLGVVVIGPYIHDRPVEHRPWRAVEASPSPALAEASPEPVEAAVRPVEPSDGGGVPTGLLAAAGVALAGAAVGVGLLRRRREGEPLAEVDVQEYWFCVLVAHTDTGSTTLQRGLVPWRAVDACEVEAEVVRRAGERLGTPEGTVYACHAVPASRWAIYEGHKMLAEGAVGLDSETPEGRAVQLLDTYAAECGLTTLDVRRLRCAVWGPGGFGEADGRDW